jgi:hypothetical protein
VTVIHTILGLILSFQFVKWIFWIILQLLALCILLTSSIHFN